jgi:pSer/pThr/pTyr-binding forkhead associated (FHA) protein
MCGRDNPGHLIFCQECGQRLAPRAAPLASSTLSAPALPPTSPLAATAETPAVRASPVPVPSSRARPPAPSVSFSKRGKAEQPTEASSADEQSRGSPAIAPMRVIEVGPGAPGQSQRLCPRCRGACDAGTLFCRFCGLSLAAPPAPPAFAPTFPVPATSVAPRSPPPPISIQPSRVRAHLVLITRDGGEGERYALGESTDLGRIEGDILFSDDPYVSPRHARVVERGGKFFLRDLQSHNGVFVRIPFALSDDDAGDDRQDKITMRPHQAVDAEPQSEQPLADQELFLVGQQVLRFELVKQGEEGFGAASENGTLVFGTPAAPRYARLSQRTVEGVVRDVYHVRRVETVIGRESGDIVFTDDPFLSRRHAALLMHGGTGQARRFTLEDLGSSNGTFLRIRNEVRLRHGDHFRIGQQLLRFGIDAADVGI